MSSSRIHCCYIVIGTEFKEKHIPEQESSRKTSISALLTMPKPLTVDPNNLCTILQEMDNSSTRPPYLPPEKSVCRSRSNS